METKITIEELLEELDGNGLILVDSFEIQKEMVEKKINKITFSKKEIMVDDRSFSISVKNNREQFIKLIEN